MSHCTKFDFQYTSRKCIVRAFQSLGLNWQDETLYDGVKVFGSIFIPIKNPTPAIIAPRSGFYYFMVNRGAYYELLIEKHKMSSSDHKKIKQMADEFQKAYIKKAAKDVVQKLSQQGKSAVLNEIPAGYEIKFGHTYDKSILIKFDNGRVIEEVKGVKGEGCVSLTEALENMLSSPDVELTTKWTDEYYETEDETIKLYDLQEV